MMFMLLRFLCQKSDATFSYLKFYWVLVSIRDT